MYALACPVAPAAARLINRPWPSHQSPRESTLSAASTSSTRTRARSAAWPERSSALTKPVRPVISTFAGLRSRLDDALVVAASSARRSVERLRALHREQRAAWPSELRPGRALDELRARGRGVRRVDSRQVDSRRLVGLIQATREETNFAFEPLPDHRLSREISSA